MMYCVCMDISMHAGRGQRISLWESVLSFHYVGFRESDSGCQPWWQTPLPAELLTGLGLSPLLFCKERSGLHPISVLK